MNRREALQSLAGLVSATGLTVTPITERQAENIALLVFRTDKRVTIEAKHRIGESMLAAVKGTKLDGVRCIVLDEGATIEAVTVPKGLANGDRQ